MNEDGENHDESESSDFDSEYDPYEENEEPLNLHKVQIGIEDNQVPNDNDQRIDYLEDTIVPNSGELIPTPVVEGRTIEYNMDNNVEEISPPGPIHVDRGDHINTTINGSINYNEKAFLEAFSTAWARGDEVPQIDVRRGQPETTMEGHQDMTRVEGGNETTNTQVRRRGKPRKKNGLN